MQEGIWRSCWNNVTQISANYLQFKKLREHLREVRFYNQTNYNPSIRFSLAQRWFDHQERNFAKMRSVKLWYFREIWYQFYIQRPNIRRDVWRKGGKKRPIFFIISALLTPSDAIEFSYRPGSPCIGVLLRTAALFWHTGTQSCRKRGGVWMEKGVEGR